MSWKMVVAVRCTRCAVFTPSEDIFHTTSGAAYCSECGPPPVPSRVQVSAARFKRSPVAVAFAAVALIVASFFVAACASQL